MNSDTRQEWAQALAIGFCLGMLFVMALVGLRTGKMVKDVA